METTHFLSPKQVALAIGVSESSLKRWCDKGVIPVSKTVGGHRKLSKSDVVSFVRKTGQQLSRPELLGLPDGESSKNTDLNNLVNPWVESVIQGDQEAASQLIVGPFITGQPLCQLFDRVIIRGLQEIRKLRKQGQIEDYQESLAIEVCLALLRDLQTLIPQPPANAMTSVGGTATGDNHPLTARLTEILFQSQGWKPTHLGCGLPFDTLSRAAERYRPNLFWISISASSCLGDSCGGLIHFHRNLPAQTGLVVSGEAISQQVKNLIPQVVFCENTRQLAAFLKTITIVTTNS